MGIIDFLERKSILIMGFGREGRSTYKYLRRHLPYKELTIADRNAVKEPVLLTDENCIRVCGENYLNIVNDFDVVIKSPGISFKDTVVGPDTLVTCQLDLFMKYAPCTKIGVTGTKGKTTTATLIYLMLKEAGLPCCLIGNIGIPVLEVMDSCEGMTAVIEMSSHQLEYTSASPHIAVLTNIYEEHLDHYRSFEGYCRAKMNIAKYQKEGDFFIYNGRQELPPFFDLDKIRSVKLPILGPKKNKDDFLLSLVNSNPFLPGRHNALDIFLAARAAGLAGAFEEDIRKGILEFKGIPHRLEYVGKYRDIIFYNDCIATVPAATEAGLEALEKVNTLIVGGMDRGIDYTGFIGLLAKEGPGLPQNIICLPDTGLKIAEGLSENSSKNIISVETMEEAVRAAYDCTKKGTICLISPAAASYNRYKNFEEKGDEFKSLVRELAESPKA